MIWSTARPPIAWKKWRRTSPPSIRTSKLVMLARDCNQRALNVLYVWNQLKPDHIETINVNCCPSDLKAHSDCSYLGSERPGSLKIEVGVDNTLRPRDLESMDQPERLSRWMYEFQKCIKCYGCRNICPVCFCKTAAWKTESWSAKAPLPPEVPIFHLVSSGAHGRPVHRRRTLRRCLPGGHPPTAAVPKSQRHRHNRFRL